MGDYIDRQTAINAAIELAEARRRWETSEGQAEIRGIDALMCAIEDLPSADVQPVRHGHWETIEGWDGDELYRCSECGDEFVLIEGTPNDNNYWFCPCCGARMDGERNG